MQHYLVIGAGGFGREVMPLALAQLKMAIADRRAALSFAVEDGAGDGEVNGVPVMLLDEALRLQSEVFFNVAIADSQVRARIADACITAGMTPFTIAAASALDLVSNAIGPGAIFCPFSLVTANARIGRFFHANLHAYVAHDCEIGDFVTFAPGVQCNGNVRVEDHAYIGTGAVIRPGSAGRKLVIGRGAVVGMGAVVTRDVPPGATVVGNPARPLVSG
jgi:sugar O-acyltransferase (sialic acid O-acetyltransferase NeuD family)